MSYYACSDWPMQLQNLCYIGGKFLKKQWCCVGGSICTGKHLVTAPVMVKVRRENKNTPKSKLTNDNSAEKEGPSKKRRFAHGRKQRSWQLYAGTQNNNDKNGFHWLEISITESLSFNIYKKRRESYKKKRDQKLVPLYIFICLNFFFHCIKFRHFKPIPFTLKVKRKLKALSVLSAVCGGCISEYRCATLINVGFIKAGKIFLTSWHSFCQSLWLFCRVISWIWWE